MKFQSLLRVDWNKIAFMRPKWYFSLKKSTYFYKYIKIIESEMTDETIVIKVMEVHQN